MKEALQGILPVWCRRQNWEPGRRLGKGGWRRAHGPLLLHLLQNLPGFHLVLDTLSLSVSGVSALLGKELPVIPELCKFTAPLGIEGNAGHTLLSPLPGALEHRVQGKDL